MLPANVAEKRAYCVREMNGKSSRSEQEEGFLHVLFFKNYLFVFSCLAVLGL